VGLFSGEDATLREGEDATLREGEDPHIEKNPDPLQEEIWTREFPINCSIAAV